MIQPSTCSLKANAESSFFSVVSCTLWDRVKVLSSRRPAVLCLPPPSYNTNRALPGAEPCAIFLRGVHFVPASCLLCSLLVALTLLTLAPLLPPLLLHLLLPLSHCPQTPFRQNFPKGKQCLAGWALASARLPCAGISALTAAATVSSGSSSDSGGKRRQHHMCAVVCG